MSSSLIKAGYANAVQKNKSDKRVIDSNQAVSDRLKLLSSILEDEKRFADSEGADFVEGLNAEQVDALFASEPVEEEPQVDVEALLEDAKLEAERIISQANEQAESIISGANSEAESIRAQAYDDGYSEGSTAGYNDGMAKTRELEESLNAKMLEQDALYEEKIAELEPKFIEVLTGIYSHIFNVDLTDRTNVVLYLLKDTIRNIEGGKTFFVHVSKDDYEVVSENREQLSVTLPSTCLVEVIEDMMLSQGSCFIETESGIFDCSLGTELELLSKELKLLSYTKE